MENLLYFFTVLVLCATFSQDVLSKKHGRLSKSSEDGKIVGGTNATIQMYPYQSYVLLQKGDDYFQCGGSIITKRCILVAAHCLTDITTAYVRVGSTDSNSGGTQYTSLALIQHPRYDARTSDYDVGVIILTKQIKIDNTNTKIVKLAKSGSDVPDGSNLTVSGWGTTSENGQTSRNLMAVTVPVVSRDECNTAYNNGITDRMICAGTAGKDSCQGDSGGPGVDDSKTQVAIVSFGIGCAQPGFPGVYAKVGNPEIRRFIRTNCGA